MVELGAGWIAQTPFGWMSRPDDPRVQLAAGGRVYWGERDEGLVATHRLAHARGIRTALKPHIWLHGSWPGEVEMRSEDDWRAWFASYQDFILHYAALAEREGIDLLVIGTELRATTASREADWRRLIARIRAAYHGPLAYAANWDEVWAVPFWDALDLIGVNAYFPLATADGRQPGDVAGLVRAWQPWLDRLGHLSAERGRPVLFTEVGYKATPDCTLRPWEHQAEGSDAGCQERAVEALFAAAWERPWLAGIWIWKWFPGCCPRPDRHPVWTPQGRPAEQVLARWFGGCGLSGPAGADTR